jgi:hypothetical protein
MKDMLFSRKMTLWRCVFLYFWDSLEDEIYPKYFLDSLLQMTYDIETGKEKVYPIDEDFFDRMKDLVKDVEVEDGDV